MSKKPTVYLSGKISGLKEPVAQAKFEKAERMFIDFGYDVVNPMKLDHDHDRTWCEYMKRDIKALCDCTMICMLPNWEESRGAVVEHTIAQMIGIPVFYEAEMYPENEISMQLNNQ